MIKKVKPYVNAVICSDIAIMLLCRKHRLPFHVSTQCSISNSKTALEIGSSRLENESAILPNNWIGKQAYSLDVLNKKDKIVLVPFAEASQTEGDMRVWLPLNIKK